ncbi:hypothetical protein [Brevundimonas naejangsanensis]|uniref:hypothetical protein n=1 Tax=Brevundimonas naejangsanensis TaxID=588932 RepID=UPI0026EB1BD3|nr:hypothetical protein [Brevundimonas naejangsanensis]
MNYVIDWVVASNLAAAGATLITGVSAVLAAVHVGRRQTKIQQDLADIERARIRHELFDRRMEFVRELRAFETRTKSTRNDDEFDLTEDDFRFIKMEQEAKFIFPRNLKPILDTLWDYGIEYAELAKHLKSTDLEERSSAQQKRSELRHKLEEAREEFDKMLDGVIRPFDD